MKIKKIKVENFLSFNEFEIDFSNKGLCLLEGFNHDEGGSNGSGKSSIFNAVIFALFGDLPKKIKVDEVINDSTGKACKVDIEIEEGANKYLISRGRKPNFLNFYVNGEKISDIDATQTQKLIEKKIGLNFDIFVNSVYFPQNSINFLSLNDTQKKTILTDIINLSIFDTALRLVKSDLKKVESDYQALVINKKNYEENLTKAQADIQNYRLKLNSFEQERSNKKQLMLNEIQTIEVSIKQSEAKIEELRVVLLNNQAQVKKLQEEKIQKISAINTLETEYDNAVRARDLLQSQIAGINSKLVKYNSVNSGTCSSCFQEVTNLNHLTAIKEAEQTQLISLENQLKGVINQIAALPSRQKLSQIRSSLDITINDATTVSNSTSNELEKTTLVVQNYKSRLGDLLKHVADENEVSNPYIEILNNTENTFGELTLKLQANSLEETKQKAKFDKLQALKDVFGTNGVRSYVFDSVLNELNFRTNEYLAKLFEKDVRILFSSQVESDGLIKQAFTTQILIDGVSVGMGKFSGGEERRLIFAVNLAIADIMANRSSNNFNIMFLDEAFDGLDFEGKRKCMDLLLDLAETKDSIMMIDHGNEFKTLFSNVLTVEKKNKISTIV